MEGAKMIVFLFLAALCVVFGQTCADPRCISCVSGPNNCTSCQGSYEVDYRGYCVTCAWGYYFNTTTRMCEGCKAKNCAQCDGNTCSFCLPYYGVNLTSATCAECPPHAISCLHNILSDYMQVTSCDDGYYEQDTRRCVACPALPNCSECADANTCFICNDGYYLPASADTCVECNAHCLSCDRTECFKCEDGYVPSGGTNCTETHCSADFCANIGQLLLPQQNGKDCGHACDASFCCNGVAPGWIGVYGYKQPSGAPADCTQFRQLVTVREGCTNQSAALIRSTCFSNDTFDIAVGSLIYPCDQAASLLSGVTGDCIVDGELLYDLAIIECPGTPKCEARCTTCINGTCRYCMAGYYLSSGICTACPVNCDRCSSSSSCTTCTSGFFADGNGNCQACTSPCSACNSQANCTSCIQGYHVANSTCVRCSTLHCTSCNAQDRCTKCDDGYVYNSINRTCVWLPNNVTQYNFGLDGTFRVLACNTGFFVSSDNSSCQACPSSCRTCSDANTCVSCATGAYVTATNQCALCNATIDGCATCTLQGSNVWCLTCAQGKGFVNNPQQCSACSKSYNCDQCLPYNHNPKGGCFSCPRGYTFDSKHRCGVSVSGADLARPSLLFGVMMALATLFIFN